MSFLLYGAYGYTGSLIAEEAARQGMDCILAGRDSEKLRPLAKRVDKPYRVIDLKDAAALDASMTEVTCVLNCAGPFMYTMEPVVEACYRTGTHYLDICGEVTVLQNLASQHNRARAAEITLLPAVGFDSVPSDCLAARVSDRLPGADILEVAIFAKGGFSRGTAKTAIEQARSGGMVRRNGRITSAPPAWRTRKVDFGEGPVMVTSAPLGDLVTGYYSAQIPNIVTYIRLPVEVDRGLRLSRYASWLLKSEKIRSGLNALIDKQPVGPSPGQRKSNTSFAWAQAANDGGGLVVSRFSGPDVYDFTVSAALKATRTMVHGSVSHGFQTPATAFGHSFVEGFEGVNIEDIL